MTTLHSPVSGLLFSVVANHVVNGRVVFPGAGYLEMGRAAVCAAVKTAATSAALNGVFFLQPLAAEVAGLYVECTVTDGRFEIRSGILASDGNSLEDAALNCSGSFSESDNWQRDEQAAVRGSVCARSSDVNALYDGYDAVGLQYGPGYRTLEQAWGAEVMAAARLRARSALHGTQVHPADLDDATCLVALASSGQGGGATRLPFAVDDARLQGAPGKLWAVRG